MGIDLESQLNNPAIQPEKVIPKLPRRRILGIIGQGAIATTAIVKCNSLLLPAEAMWASEAGDSRIASSPTATKKPSVTTSPTATPTPTATATRTPTPQVTESVKYIENKYVIDGIEITGSPIFIKNTIKAVNALQKTSFYAEVKKYTGIIKEYEYSGMNVFADRPTFLVGRPTWQSDTLWYAGAIVHDTHHSKLYFEAKKSLDGREPSEEVWTGKEAEKQCLDIQMRSLQEIKAPQYMIDNIKRLMDNPQYQNIPVASRSW